MINVLMNEITNELNENYKIRFKDLNVSDETKRIYNNIQDVFSSFYEF
jgi:uncharacterized protein YpuA (DUF1002 family)